MKYIIENGFLVSAKVEEKESKFNGKKFNIGKLVIREAYFDDKECKADENIFYLDCPAEKIDSVKEFVGHKVSVEGILNVVVTNKEGKSLRYYRFTCDSIDKID